MNHSVATMSADSFPADKQPATKFSAPEMLKQLAWVPPTKSCGHHAEQSLHGDPPSPIVSRVA